MSIEAMNQKALVLATEILVACDECELQSQYPELDDKILELAQMLQLITRVIAKKKQDE